MKDIPLKRIARLYLAAFIVLFLVAWSNPANAETGNVTVTDQSILSYTINDGAGTAGSVMNQIYLDTTNYNEWESFHINLSLQSPTFALDSETSQFTCSAGGTCAGYVWYVKQYQKLYFAFTTLSVTSSPISLSYTKNIVANITGMTRIKTDCTTTLAQPILLYKETVGTPRCLGGLYESVTVDSTTTDHYDVTYPFSNAFILNVTKGGSVNDRWVVYDVDGNIYQTGTMDKLNFALANNSYNGIIANVSLPSGAHTIVNINITGFPGFVAPPTPPTVDPLTGVGIAFDANSYTIGGTANISWIRTIPTPFGYQDDIYLNQPGQSGTIKKILVSSPVDVGFIKTNDFPVAGKYQVTFERSVIGLFPSVLASDNATVTAEQSSYIIINSTIPSNYPFNFTWLLGHTPALQVVTNGIEIYQMSSGWIVDTCYNSNIVANTEYTCTATVPAAGDYKVVLRDIAKGNVVTVFTKAVDGYKPPAKNITASSISIDKTTYYRGDDMQIIFEIDNTNYSNFMTFYSFWNTTLHKNIANYKLDGKQFGTTDNVLGSYLDSWDFKRTLSGSGAYNISLMAKNDTTEFVLDFVNFTFVDANRRGISLSLKNKTICTNEAQVFTYTITENVTLRIQESSTGKIVASYNISESGSLRYKTTKPGVYLVSLQAIGDGTIQALDDYTVTSNCGAAGAVTTPVSGAGQAQQVAAMITTPIFWALIVTAGLMIAIAWRTRDGFAAGSVGILSAGVFAFMTWLPLWIFFSVLIIAALLLSSSLVAKQLKKTG